MSFSLDQFYQLNRKALIWAILAVVLWLMRDFFALIFMTFLLAFMAAPLTRLGARRLRLPERVALVIVYLLFLALLTAFARFVPPAVAREVNLLAGNVETLQTRLFEAKNELVDRFPPLRRMVPELIRGELDDRQLEILDAESRAEQVQLGIADAELAEFLASGAAPEGREPVFRKFALDADQRLLNAAFERMRPGIVSGARAGATLLYQATATILLALLFSFLILMDIARIRAQVQALKSSRLRDFYEAAAMPVVRFGYVVGRAFQAQAMIAVTNTVLTALGLVLLSIPSLTMLSVIVFLCSFIPVLGVFISTTPIVLVALNAGGVGLALAAIGLVIVIHAIEAYMLNPMIYGQHFNLNPVLVLIVLFIAHHAFGVWGMLLGVPVTQYILHDVFGVPVWNEKRMPRATARTPDG
ncbi:MAG: AI-2E family transporter [Gammaproteobacteria bacterium]